MFIGLQRWLNTIPVSDEVWRKQLILLQACFLLFIIGCSSWGLLLLIGSAERYIGIVSMLCGLFGAVTHIGALLLLRRAQVGRSIALSIGSILCVLGVWPFVVGVAYATTLFVLYVVPVMIAALYTNWRGLTITLAIILGELLLTLVPGVHQATEFLPQQASQHMQLVAAYATGLCAIGVFLLLIGQTLRSQLLLAQQREQELEQIRNGLEDEVALRTAALGTALEEVRAQAATQQRLLEENARQTTIIRQLSVPILPVAPSILIMPLIGELDSVRLKLMHEEALQRVGRAHTLLLDVTGVPMIDSDVAQGLLSLIQSLRLMGVQGVLVGIRPEVAQTMIALNIRLHGIHTYPNIERAVRHLYR